VKQKGTPKTLRRAIQNGLEAYGFKNNEKIAKYVLEHVHDYIAQKAISLDENEDAILKRFFDKIFREE